LLLANVAVLGLPKVHVVLLHLLLTWVRLLLHVLLLRIRMVHLLLLVSTLATVSAATTTVALIRTLA
jgi:hypothetical protein